MTPTPTPRGASAIRDWHYIGPIVLCAANKPRFGTIADIPGIYVIEFANEGYVGHSANLLRRLTEYRNPTDSIRERYIRHLITQSGGGNAFCLTGPTLKDLSPRLQLEQAIIHELRAGGATLINKTATPSRRFMEFKLEQLRAMVTEIQEKLSNLDHQDQPSTPPVLPPT